jgi:surfeit locus 1 family protein
MRLRFRFSPVPFIATLLVVAVGILLGNWQVPAAATEDGAAGPARRSGDPAPLVLDGTAARSTPPPPSSTACIVTGEFVPDWPLFLDNRPHEGRTGFVLLMPFKIADADDVVLVARGWVPRDPAVHDRVPQVATPSGRTTIEGMAVRLHGRA